MKLPALFLASLLTMWAGISHATADPAFDAMMQRVVGNAVTVSFGRDGTPVTAPSAPLGTPAVGRAGIRQTNEGIFLEQLHNTRLPGGGGSVPTRTKIALSFETVGKGLYRGAVVASALGIAWETGNALYDIWGDFGLTAGPGGPQSPASQFTISNGLQYTFSGSSSGNQFSANRTGPYYPTGEALCQQHIINLGPTANSRTCVFQGFRANGVDQNWTVFQNGSPFSGVTAWARTDATCPSGWYRVGTTCTEEQPTQQLTEQQFLDQIASLSGWPTGTDLALREAGLLPGASTELANEIAAQPQTFTQVEFQTGTSAVEIGAPIVEEETITNPDGSTVTRTTTRTRTATAAGNQITESGQATTTTTTRAPDGTVTGVTTAVATATTPASPNALQDPANPLADLELCGLPNTPPCRIDETGTAEPLPDDGQATATGLLATLQTCADDLLACLPSLPDINWNFALPSGCAPIALGGGFEQWIEPIDICEWQPMFHELMSLVWAAAGLFGAIAIVRPRSAA